MGSNGDMGDLAGQAYAVFDEATGELDFVRSDEAHENGKVGTVHSVSSTLHSPKDCHAIVTCC